MTGYTRSPDSMLVSAGGLGLHIVVSGGIGEGHTPLSAFDAALFQCGVHNYNLIPLSSVIPPGARVAAGARYQGPAHEYGHRLFVVKAEIRAAERGTVIAAGLGWLQWGDGRGVFVEHELRGSGSCPCDLKQTLAGRITESLRDLAQVRGVAFTTEAVCTHIVATRVDSRPACALVVAVYQADGWLNAATPEGAA